MVYRLGRREDLDPGLVPLHLQTEGRSGAVTSDASERVHRHVSPDRRPDTDCQTDHNPPAFLGECEGGESSGNNNSYAVLRYDTDTLLVTLTYLG